MLQLEKLKKNLIKLRKSEMDEILTKVFRENSDILLQVQTEEQLFLGLTADGNKGKKIKPKYKKTTIAIKKRKGQPTDRVTLRDKGDFYRRIKVSIKDNEVTFKGTDTKTPKLLKKYGDSVIGLHKSNARLVGQLLKQEIQKKITKIILNGI